MYLINLLNSVNIYYKVFYVFSVWFQEDLEGKHNRPGDRSNKGVCALSHRDRRPGGGGGRLLRPGLYTGELRLEDVLVIEVAYAPGDPSDCQFLLILMEGGGFNPPRRRQSGSGCGFLPRGARSPSAAPAYVGPPRPVKGQLWVRAAIRDRSSFLARMADASSTAW